MSSDEPAQRVADDVLRFEVSCISAGCELLEHATDLAFAKTEIAKRSKRFGVCLHPLWIHGPAIFIAVGVCEPHPG